MYPLRTGMIPPQLPGSPAWLRPGTPALAKFLHDLGYNTGQFGTVDRLRRLYGSEFIEGTLDEIIVWKEHFNRLVELRAKEFVSAAEYQEMLAIQQEFRRDMTRQGARQHIER